MPSEQQAVTQLQNLQIVPASLEGIVVKRTESRTEAATPEETLVIEDQVDAIPAFEAGLISTPMLHQTQAS